MLELEYLPENIHIMDIFISYNFLVIHDMKLGTTFIATLYCHCTADFKISYIYDSFLTLGPFQRFRGSEEKDHLLLGI